jgi:hypothetical protein
MMEQQEVQTLAPMPAVPALQKRSGRTAPERAERVCEWKTFLLPSRRQRIELDS